MDEDNSGQIEIEELEKAFADFKIDEVFEKPTLELTQTNSYELVPRTPKRVEITTSTPIFDIDENAEKVLDLKKLKI